MPTEGNEKENDVVSALQKRFGEEAIFRLGEAHTQKVEGISTGSISLDLALGVGGIPRGRVTEIYGPESSGKTTVCQHVVAEVQRMGGSAAFIDMEHAFDPLYAQRTGVDTDKLIFSQPDTGEQALEIVEALVRSGDVDLIIVDSVAALVPRSEIEGDMGDATMGMQARLMSQALRKLSGVIKKTNTAVVFTNQLRQKIGVVFGNPETTTGGMALKFYASVRMDVRRIETLKNGTDVFGSRSRVKVVKNKVAAPHKQAEFDILFNHGISVEGDILDNAIKSGALLKRGNSIYHGEVRIGAGREAARQYLIEHPELTRELRESILSVSMEPDKFVPEQGEE